MSCREASSWIPANRFVNVSCKASATARPPTPSAVSIGVIDIPRSCSTTNAPTKKTTTRVMMPMMDAERDRPDSTRPVALCNHPLAMRAISEQMVATAAMKTTRATGSFHRSGSSCQRSTRRKPNSAPHTGSNPVNASTSTSSTVLVVRRASARKRRSTTRSNIQPTKVPASVQPRIRMRSNWRRVIVWTRKKGTPKRVPCSCQVEGKTEASRAVITSPPLPIQGHGLGVRTCRTNARHEHPDERGAKVRHFEGSRTRKTSEGYGR